MAYSVIWTRQALRKLTDLLAAATDQAAVSDASVRAERLLESDPLNQGEDRDRGRRILVTSVDKGNDAVDMAKGLGSRHMAAAGISMHSKAIAFCVSQSTGAVRVYRDGREKLHIEPLARPHVWQPFKLETHEGEDEGVS